MARALYGRRATGTDGDDDEAIGDAMGLMGMTREQAEDYVRASRPAAPPAPAERRVEVLSCCMDAVRLFAALAGQWRMALTAIPTPAGPTVISTPVSIDLPSAESAARWLGLAPSPRLLGDLRIMEGEALAAMAARSEGRR